MKNYLSILIAILWSNMLLKAQCPPANYLFASQEQITDFNEMYPDCSQFRNSIRIAESIGSNLSFTPITDLSGLSKIKVIEGDLIIVGNNHLESLIGLENLNKVHGKLVIESNPNLKNINTNLNKSLESVGGLIIRDNPSLEDNAGNLTIQRVNGNVLIADNNLFNNLSFYPNITVIYGNLTIANNANLETLCGLTNSTTVYGNLTIKNNPALVSLEGIHFLEKVKKELIISGNNQLNECCVLAYIAESVYSPNKIVLENNGINCNDSYVVNECASLNDNDCEMPIEINFFGGYDINSIIVAGNRNTSYNYNVSCGDSGNFTSAEIIELPVGNYNEITITDPETNCQFIARFNGGGLAIELVDFYGIKSNTGNQLFWSTATETDNDYFTVLHSEDGVNFRSLTTINGAGNSSVVNRYSYTDYTTTKHSYYQIRSTDFNGVSEVSDIIEISRSATDEAVVISPVPANGFVDISFDDELKSEVKITISEIDGKVIKTVSAGKNTKDITLNIETLNAGVFLVKITGGDINYVKRIIVK